MSEHPHTAFIVMVRAHLAKTETRNRYGLLRAKILENTIQELLTFKRHRKRHVSGRH